MLIIETLPLLRQAVRRFRAEGKRIALAPTMGNLHDGHMALVEAGKSRADVVVVSIFVNPLQFANAGDLARYPRTLQEDCEKLSQHNVDLLFAPADADLYPHGIHPHTYVEVPALSTMLEGAARPEHFRGVATIVSKLFNLIQPDIACFDEKDYQQLALIRTMVEHMNYDIEIVGVATVRAKDGPALSSRNGHLSADQRKIAPGLNEVINVMAQKLLAEERNSEEMILIARQTLTDRGFHADDIQVRDAATLLQPDASSQCIVILIPAWPGQTRLIDNKIVALTWRTGD